MRVACSSSSAAIAEGRDPGNTLRARIANRHRVEADDDWPDVTPLRETVGDPPRFPVEVMPYWLQAMVEGVAEATQTPHELAWEHRA